MGPKPPRGPETILRRVLPRDEFETISGDLEEGFHDIAMRAGRRAALWWLWRQVGSVAAARLLTLSQNVLDAGRRRSMMSGFKHDLRYALRALGKQPAFTTTVVLMLALGIGANIAIFSLIHAVLLKPLPFADPDRLMLVHMLAPQRDAPGELRPNVWSYPKYQVFRDQQQVFESVALFRPATWNLTGTGTPERLPGEFVEAAYFDVLRIEASAGRTFSLDETRVPPSAPLVVLGHGFWTRRFGADPNVIGRTVGLNAIPHTIVGVLPVGFRGLSGEAEIWVPLTTLPAEDLKEPHSHSYTLIARLKPDVAVEQAQSAAQHLGDVIDRQYPDTFSTRGSRWSATAVPLHGERTDPLIRRSILILFGAVAAVLLIVCINVANLSFARAMARQREVGIRLAVGASRLRVMRQLMTESLLLSCIGAVAGGF
ncbi:MAG TPA: ABC transporter permease, partial [Gemmatimonadaceae bacterium]|nr:ABC transporter permease [Gemmatimonadaceae bacterium]